MIVFPCQVCQTPLCAQPEQAGQLVRCPTCSTTLRVPIESAVEAPAETVSTISGAPPPPTTSATRTFIHSLNQRGAGSGKRYGFNCAYCSSRLEATESMAAQEGQCPTCGNQITIPILDRYGRLIDPKTREIIKQAPHPVHAYAAAGDRAPGILRTSEGRQVIRCSRCGNHSPISANNCKSCGMPFTMEGTTVEAASTSNGFCVASLVLGIIGLPAGCTVLLPLLAIVFGVIGLSQISRSDSPGTGGRGMAIGGIICGGLGLLFAFLYFS